MVSKRPIRGDERQATIADPSADRRRMRMIRLLNSNDPTDAGPRLRHDGDTPLLRLIARVTASCHAEVGGRVSWRPGIADPHRQSRFGEQSESAARSLLPGVLSREEVALGLQA